VNASAPNHLRARSPGPSGPGRLGAAILHYRQPEDALRTVEALLAQTLPPDHVLVVDNASGDPFVEPLRARLPDRVRLVVAAENRGYAAGMNLALRELLGSGARLLLLLTHECLLAPTALERLVARASEQPGVGVTGPLLAYRSAPDQTFSAGVRLDPRNWDVRHIGSREPLAAWRDGAPRPVDSLDGSCMLLRSEVVESIGPLDERYFMYWEETEYAARARRAGWTVECVPGAVAWQEPKGVPPYLDTRNRLRFVAQTAPPRMLARELLRVPVRLVREQLSSSTPPERRAGLPLRALGLRDFVLRRWGPPRAS
jgi:N-acetylglucosaminyl-diphospho-decaprenol L-rhamnosyltransferase